MLIHNCSLSQLRLIANTLSAWVKPGDCLALWGGLGVGKTTFSRFFLQALDPTLEQVPSPTFTIVQTYNSPVGEIWHCDLYRLTHPNDILEIGLEDALYAAVCLIEWPEKMGDYLPQKRLDIRLEIANTETRTVTITPIGFTNDALMSNLSSLCPR